MHAITNNSHASYLSIVSSFKISYSFTVVLVIPLVTHCSKNFSGACTENFSGELIQVCSQKKEKEWIKSLRFGSGIITFVLLLPVVLCPTLLAQIQPGLPHRGILPWVRQYGEQRHPFHLHTG